MRLSDILKGTAVTLGLLMGTSLQIYAGDVPKKEVIVEEQKESVEAIPVSVSEVKSCVAAVFEVQKAAYIKKGTHILMSKCNYNESREAAGVVALISSEINDNDNEPALLNGKYASRAGKIQFYATSIEVHNYLIEGIYSEERIPSTYPPNNL